MSKAATRMFIACASGVNVERNEKQKLTYLTISSTMEFKVSDNLKSITLPYSSGFFQLYAVSTLLRDVIPIWLWYPGYSGRLRFRSFSISSVLMLC